MQVLEYGNYLKLRSLWRQKCNNFSTSQCLTPYKLNWILAWTCDNEDFCWTENFHSRSLSEAKNNLLASLLKRSLQKSTRYLFSQKPPSRQIPAHQYNLMAMAWASAECATPSGAKVRKKIWNWVLCGTMPIQNWWIPKLEKKNQLFNKVCILCRICTLTKSRLSF